MNKANSKWSLITRDKAKRDRAKDMMLLMIKAASIIDREDRKSSWIWNYQSH